MINRRIQWVKYDSLPMVCVECGRYGHYREVCTYKVGKEADSLGGKINHQSRKWCCRKR
ncbi:hypothetical protein Gohar_020465 [Gossypium harknessii]|uniref:CCHC-type domain-containing protein n=1 Tax=Gossypium harknessii TaxID=34285 RepID=A0A7J9HYB3_9ROSI|nr:hypothetical protein [Gossypium harknessii]